MNTIYLVTGNKKITVNLENGRIIIKNDISELSIPYGDVDSIEIRDGRMYGKRTGGVFGVPEYLVGMQSNKEFSMHSVAVYTQVEKNIIVRYNKKKRKEIFIFNFKTAEETSKFYEYMKKQIGT